MPVETPGASQEGTLVIEQFLMANYRFRRNILNGKVEFAVLPKADNKAEGNTVEMIGSLSCASDEADLEYRPLTPDLRTYSGGSSSIRFVRGHHQQSPSAEGCHWLASKHLYSDS